MQLLSVLPKFLLEMVLIFFIVTVVLASSLSVEASAILISTLGVFGIASVRLLPIANLTAASRPIPELPPVIKIDFCDKSVVIGLKLRFASK